MSAPVVSPGRARLFAVSGIAIIVDGIISWSAFLYLATQRPDFDWIRDAGSRLGERGATNAFAFNLLTHFTSAPLWLLFAFGLYRALPPRPASIIASALIALGAVVSFLAGIITLDPASAETSRLHILVAIPLFLGFPVALLLTGRALSRGDRSGGARTLSFVNGAIAVLLTVAAFVVPPEFMGLLQRTVITVYSVWLVGMGIWLLSLSLQAPPLAAARRRT